MACKKINISLPEEVLDRLEKIAKAEGRTKSNMVARIIINFYGNLSKKNAMRAGGMEF